jgi:hypothetical protein
MLHNAIQILQSKCETVRNTDIGGHAQPHCCLHLFLRQLSGLILDLQHCFLQHVPWPIQYRVTGNLFLSSCLGPYKSTGSTLQAAAWAHTGVLATFVRQLHEPIQRTWQHPSGSCMAWAHTGLLAAFPQVALWTHPEGLAAFFCSCMGPYKEHGSTHQAALWVHTGLLAAFPQAALWAHLGGLAAFFGSCMGPYKEHGSSHQAALWAHTGLLASSSGSFSVAAATRADPS